MNFVKEEILKEFKRFVPPVASKHRHFKFWMVQIPTLLIILLNIASSLVAFYIFPSTPPKDLYDYNLNTLQPSFVAMGTLAVVFLFTVLATIRPTLNSIVDRFVSGLESNINKKSRR